MASSRWTEQDLANLSKRNGPLRAQQAEGVVKAQSKYRNIRTQVDGITFDSKREANYWQELQLREKSGEITNLRRQVDCPLCCPNGDGTSSVVCVYRADFMFEDKAGATHVVDAKGKRTREYALKAKWLKLQSGIVIEEV